MDGVSSVAIQTRWLEPRDYEIVCRIEEESEIFRPWKKEELFAVLRRDEYVGMVAQEGRRVVGFMVYKLNPDSIELVKLGIREKARGRKIEHELIRWLKTKLNPVGRDKLVYFVREGELSTLRYLRSVGFNAVGVRRGYFEDTEEDAFQMEYRA